MLYDKLFWIGFSGDTPSRITDSSLVKIIGVVVDCSDSLTILIFLLRLLAYPEGVLECSWILDSL